MKAKNLKKVSPFFLALLIMAVSLQATAQRGVRNNGNQEVRKVTQSVKPQRVNNQNRTKFANQRSNVKYGNRVNTRANINVSFGNNRVLPRTCAPVIRPSVVRLNYNNGHRISFLPQNSIQFRGVNQDYFLARGQFYTPTHRGYVATVAPVGIRVNFLPQKAVKVFYNRNVYYQLGNVLLAPIVTRKGNIAYELAGYM